MSREVTEREIEAILKLGGPERYNYTIKFISDVGELWGLYDDGWALAAGGNQVTSLAIWPSKEYALLNADNEWNNYKPKSINLIDFINEFTPNLKKDDVVICIFPTRDNKGVFPTHSELLNDIKNELSHYT